MSSLSVIVNSCALGPKADIVSSGGQPYANRAWLLRNVLLPLYTSWCSPFREVIVVGEFEPGDGYEYVHSPSVHFSCADALAQRDAGFAALKHTSVEYVLFQHDDHLYDPNNVIPRPTAADVLSPSRWTRARGAEEQLNNGEAAGHISGHACLMKPHVMRNGFKWTDSPPVFVWDHHITNLLLDHGNIVQYAPTVKVYDVEAGATPWI